MKLYRLLNHNHDVYRKDFSALTENMQALKLFVDEIETKTDSVHLNQSIQECIKSASLPLNLTTDTIKAIPQTAGIYRFYSEDGALLYIGKSVNLRSRVLSHFASAHFLPKELKLAQRVHTLNWQVTAGELSALLLEATLIKQHQPLFNRQLRKTRTLFGLTLVSTAQEAYYRVEIIPLKNITANTLSPIFGLFKHKKQALQILIDLVKREGFCSKYLNLEKTKGACFQYQLGKCDGACVGKIDPVSFNQKLEKALARYHVKAWPYKGPVIIEEKDAQGKKAIFHLIYRWCYIASSPHKNKLVKIDVTDQRYPFDLDIYKIILNYISSRKISVF